jgi:hypothetical protein
MVSGALSLRGFGAALKAALHLSGTSPKPYMKPVQESCLECIAGTVQRDMLLPPLPSPFMTPFLTVKDAARLTGKSPSSIRRVIYPILKNDSHPDRPDIEPSVEEVVKLRMKGENFAWRLSEELLRRKLPLEPGPEKGSPQSSKTTAHGDGELLAMLRRELEIKNQQITQQSEVIGKQMELMSGLSERLREGNILIGSLQQRLALKDGRESNTTESIKAKSPGSAQPEKGKKIAPKTNKAKRSFLWRFFR